MATGGGDEPPELTKIKKNLLLDMQSATFGAVASTDEAGARAEATTKYKSVTVESLWTGSDVVILFMRRFG